ncbi:MAG: ferrochelatase [Ignavibacteriales bacterium]|nr:ferrochelatase [Ignavibacteriales bacterium]
MAKRIGIVLFQLGGPDSIDAVEPFLNNLFLDADIIDFPGAFLARRYLAQKIASRRSGPIGRHYAEIGGKSPINELTNRQAKALQQWLQSRSIDARVVTAMRYWHPMTKEAIETLKRERIDEILLLPLYPQFSRATTYSSVNEWRREITRLAFHVPARLICCYPNHPKYISALVRNIRRTMDRFGETDPASIDLVFSAHGVPVEFIRKGDPYQLQIEETVRCVVREGAWKSPHTICYQSKVGPARWLEPSLTKTIRTLAAAGRKNLLIVPIAFVTEHIETLHEINIEAREVARELGIERFEMTPALNDDPLFIECLGDLVESALNNSAERNNICAILWSSRNKEPEPALCPWYTLTKGTHAGL